MKVLKAIWVVYVLIIALVPFVLTYPLVYYLTANSKRYPLAHKYRRIWGKYICFMAGLKLEVTFEEELDLNRTYIICPNHCSYLDIIATSCGLPFYFIFMAKHELSKIPLFGRFFRTIDIAVDRKNRRKSVEAFIFANKRIKNGSSILLFPEGGITDESPRLSRFKGGAFKLAIKNQVPILPISLLDNYKRLPNDNFFGVSPGKIRMLVHRPIEVTNLILEDEKELNQKVFSIIEESLKKHIDYPNS